ncbi:hypothetical protein C1X35_01045 [Pseudomonas sp. FW306-1C-G01A]|nr:hypothetical protein C1X56_25235 [Pseudomonas sp. GW101-1A09]PMV91426.1 hypothetical protein C1X51_21510 [Pseudomonas sp. FW306-2-2C-B10A]PMV97677.1 hypothetical protein C1X55_16205 [Pseudomonas sp. GW460-C8]PMW02367.1 hypothetical protein C1X50_25080 [Pseudomonas sp. MPR-TSA4]PMW11724.1 hypothetical protein C1X40_27505 [Pseudomonas sp. GW456-11-11-14-TSB2]PMW11837.1 hypothetical protein C1X52_20555 [Pseudomonas sp. FW306-2-1A-C05A]PMW21421.1 hypothetical protein C1X53_16130 [Pseudomonas s
MIAVTAPTTISAMPLRHRVPGKHNSSPRQVAKIISRDSNRLASVMGRRRDAMVQPPSSFQDLK